MFTRTSRALAVSFRRYHKKLLFVIFAGAGTFVLFSLAIEMYFRIRYPRPAIGPAPVIADAVLGWDTTPSLRPLGQTGAALSVYFLGDSFTDGTAWPRYALSSLQDRGLSLRGYALGVPGYGTTQSLLKLQKHFDEHHPTVVVLLFFAWNDFRDNARHPGVFYAPNLLGTPYLLPATSRDYEVFLDPPSLPSRVLSRSEVHVRIFQRYILKFTGWIMRQSHDIFARLHLPGKVYYDEPASWRPFYETKSAQSLYVQQAHAATEAALGAMQAFLEERASTLLVIGIDNAFTVDEDVLRRHVPETDDFDQTLPLAVLENMLHARGIPFVSALPALRAEHERSGKKVYIGPSGSLLAHFEDPGERIIGELAAEAIAATLERQP